MKALIHAPALLFTLAGLSACSGPPMEAESPPQSVQIDGMAYQVEQLTVGTWTVAAPPALDSDPQKKYRLIQAIEKASDCKVTDSSYGPHAATLSAQVACSSKLKN